MVGIVSMTGRPEHQGGDVMRVFFLALLAEIMNLKKTRYYLLSFPSFESLKNR
jgi:hypothetical protein